MKLALMMVAVGWLAVAHAEDIVFPSTAGILNVRDFGAKGDGVTDDTAALQKAYESTGLIYLPNGTYLVSESIAAPERKGGAASRRILQGQSKEKTIIKLKDHSPGFDAPTHHRPILRVSWGVAQAFRNAVRNLTIDAGSDNPGAIGVEYFASNQGGMHDVTIRSANGKGAIGLMMVGDNGPMLVKNLRVTGFDVGVLAQPNHDVVMEHVQLARQNQCGLEVSRGGKVFVRDLQSDNAVTAVRAGPRQFVLLDGILKGGSGTAVEVTGTALIRNLTVDGYTNAIHSKTGDVPGPRVAEWTSSSPASLFPSPPSTLNLPVKETPLATWDDPADWVDATGGIPPTPHAQDVTESFQKAIDAGAKTIYFPKGNWVFTDIHVRHAVHHIIGMEWGFKGKGSPRFIIEDGSAPVVVIERFESLYFHLRVEHASARTLVLSSLNADGIVCRPGSGDLFIEDVCCGRLEINQNHVWARQFNPEDQKRTAIINDGGTLWLLGLKTEGPATKLDATNHSRNEIYAYVLANAAANPGPMFLTRDSALSLTVCEDVIRKAPFAVIVRETRGSETKDLSGSRGACSIPLFTGYPLPK